MEDTARRWGLQPEYEDSQRRPRWAPDSTVEAVIEVLKRDQDLDSPPSGDEVWFTRSGATDLPGRFAGRHLVLEDGTEVGPVDRLTPDLPLGYHRLSDPETGKATMAVVSPGTCHLPGFRAWGWAAQLYAARSPGSWGMGDFADAAAIGRHMAAASRAGGAAPLLLLNPLHAADPSRQPEPSPYKAGSRCFRSPLYLRVEEVPGAESLGADLAALADQGRALNAEPTIDRSPVWAAKRDALALVWAATRQRALPAVEAALAADAVLGAFAAYCTACEHHGDRWAAWPAELRSPSGTGWTAIHDGHGDQLRFHAWLQLLIAGQLDAAHAEVALGHDLAVGTDVHGFDAWYWQDLFVLDGTRVGAPPDEFNTQGQDWDLPPLDPFRLRAARYEPFVRMLRCNLSHGDLLRIDHVMGLFRLFWIPAEAGAADGVYVRQPTAELLDLVALESVRAGTTVVGEDLGTVEPGVREELDDRRIMAYRVMSLAEGPPATFKELSLASFTTHDLPTLAGLWTGADLAAQERLDLHPNVESTEAARGRLRDWLGVDDDAPAEEVTVAAYASLAEAPSRVVVGSLEDAAGLLERPNMPGTLDQWPNWRQPLPHPVDEVLATPLASTLTETLASR